MPEGDTIFRAARTLEKVLGGKTLTGVESILPEIASAGLAGRVVEKVEARGKNLLVRFDDGRVLHTHMRMTGSWHVYRHGERWQRPRRQARVVFATADFVTVCFDAPVVRLLSAAQESRDPALAGLGPDILAPDFDFAEVRRRLREQDALALGEAVMRQWVVAGIGNVYKSETLFLCGLDPFRTVGATPDRDLDLLLERARTLMSANLRVGARTTRASLTRERTWVYGRSGRPCRRCGTAIRMRRQGADARSTYFCPACQAG